MSAIRKVGIELEGGWDRLPPCGSVYHDESVYTEGEYVGEVSSPPLPVGRVPGWVVRNYPQHVNETCGLHAHVSLRNDLVYARLMEEGFYRFMLGKLEEWGKAAVPHFAPFWHRLEGENRFARVGFYPDAQVRARWKTNIRYYQINYCFSFHGTVEFRLLPMFPHAEQAVEAVSVLLGCIEEWLIAKNKEKEKDLSLIIRTADNVCHSSVHYAEQAVEAVSVLLDTTEEWLIAENKEEEKDLSLIIRTADNVCHSSVHF